MKVEAYEDLATYCRRDWPLVAEGRSDIEIFDEFFEMGSHLPIEMPATRVTQHVERKWIEGGRPVYKIETPLAYQFAATEIKIESRHLELPFPAICIQTDINENFPWYEKFGPIRGVLAGFCDSVSQFSNADRVMNINVQFCNIDESRNRFGEILKPVRDVLGWGPTTQRIERNLEITFFDEEPVDDLLTKVENYIHDRGCEPENNLSNEQWVAICRLVFSACFIAMGDHDFVIPDMTRKYREKYQKARNQGNVVREQEILNKFKNRKEYRMVAETILPKPPPSGDPRSKDGDSQPGSEYRYRRYRAPHMRRVRVGPRNDWKYDVRFFPTTVARPDLPVNPNARKRFKISKSV